MRTIKLVIITFILAIGAEKVMAQQEAMYTQYMFNTLAINPAYAGSRNVTSATALYRSQWVGIKGAPKTATFTMDAPIDDKKIGLGLQVYNDRLGITNTSGGIISYAYRIRMSKGTLALGLQGGVSQYRADFANVDLGSDASPDLAFSNNVNKALLDFGVGVYYSTDKFYLGLSSPQLLNNKLTNLTVEGNNGYTGQDMHLFLATGYVFPVGEDLHLKPSVLIKYVKGAPIEADINGTVWIKDVLGVGAMYRTKADISGLVEFQVSPQIRIGYSYDHSTTKLVSYNSGSHEIMLRYEFGFTKGKIISPRFF
ncbi:PorP/SprF family type IX secretion system membrane protein [Mucilaginibacter sp. KACC 22063]|uniref:PorP/SprF family type IX secretion system membrane protein n=1 Tax=Mucilaginibacter sp. KACC 22063 TaxID=3025666 RepID=UPI00236552E4|nr:type IX secretion system membrane protein PorP/SprF [Mucilaginibacter sp. KACC 22063]WDF53339.1 type IX secretion system membrane protein PorP/SprF [Mucilaginibacter sp. KACC 22063]